MSQRLAEELAAKVVGSVVRSGVRDDILKLLLEAVENNVRESAIEAILISVGQATVERDRAWVRELAGEWAPKTGLRTATTPAEVEKEIRTWVAGRIAETRQGAYTAGYEDCFQAAVSKGVKLGWAAHEAGKGLEEALKAGSTLKPT